MLTWRPRLCPPLHLALPVHDIDAARHLYGEVLGFDRGRSDVRWTDGNLDGQWTMFFLDPSGNAWELKALKDLSQLFALSRP